MFVLGLVAIMSLVGWGAQTQRAHACAEAAELYRSAATGLADETQRYLDDPYTIPSLENVADDFRDAERLECN